MNSEKIEELLLAFPFLLGHLNTAAQRNLGKTAMLSTMLIRYHTCHLKRQQSKTTFNLKSTEMYCF